MQVKISGAFWSHGDTKQSSRRLPSPWKVAMTVRIPRFNHAADWGSPCFFPESTAFPSHGAGTPVIIHSWGILHDFPLQNPPNSGSFGSSINAGFHQWGYPKLAGCLISGKIPLKMDGLWVPLFQEPPIWGNPGSVDLGPLAPSPALRASSCSAPSCGTRPMTGSERIGQCLQFSLGNSFLDDFWWFLMTCWWFWTLGICWKPLWIW